MQLVSLLLAVLSAGNLPRIHPQLPTLPRLDTQELEGRITGGQEAEPGQFPYQVGLSLLVGTSYYWCGGTLLSDSWILTAAHCADGADAVTAYLGAIDIRDDKEVGQQRVNASKNNIIVHAEWNSSTLANDIALINLPNKIVVNDRIKPATLPKMNDGQYSTYVGDMAWASGWGKDSDSATTISRILRFIQVPIIRQRTCNMLYFGSITEKMICISGSGGKSTCNGDSGGPLVVKVGDINYVIGATSFGISLGCEKGWPAVFTRVTSYLDWIEAKSGIVNK